MRGIALRDPQSPIVKEGTRVFISQKITGEVLEFLMGTEPGRWLWIDEIDAWCTEFVFGIQVWGWVHIVFSNEWIKFVLMKPLLASLWSASVRWPGVSELFFGLKCDQFYHSWSHRINKLRLRILELEDVCPFLLFWYICDKNCDYLWKYCLLLW